MNISSVKVAGDIPPEVRHAKKSRIRYMILLILFVITTLNYADRSVISIAGTPMSKELGLNPVAMGYIFSAFAWAYVIGQIPGGWLLDRFGSKKIYAFSIFFWSLFTLLQGFIGIFSIAVAIIILFVLRFMVGLAEAPSFPANSRIVSAWFPTKERGTAAAIFNSAQYFATVLFAPIIGWLTSSYGWKYGFVIMGMVGIVFSGIWLKTIYGPKDHPRVNEAELDYIEQGGALVNLDQVKKDADISAVPKWGYIKQLLKNRMLLGIYIAQYCLNTLTYFFLTWFPVYLVKERGMSILKVGFVASLPALCGFAGGILGGLISDYLLKKGKSLSVARKIPIVIGMLLSTSMIICNYVKVDWLIVGIMALAFFGKGIGALGWAVVADTSPKEIGGLSGGLFNMFGNIAGITTPIIIGYILQATGSFNGALMFVGANALMVILCYLLIVGEIKRFELKKV
jgi:ACS family glucarate transporter-like MFS transporter